MVFPHLQLHIINESAIIVNYEYQFVMKGRAYPYLRLHIHEIAIIVNCEDKFVMKGRA